MYMSEKHPKYAQLAKTLFEPIWLASPVIINNKQILMVNKESDLPDPGISTHTPYSYHFAPEYIGDYFDRAGSDWHRYYVRGELIFDYVWHAPLNFLHDRLEMESR
jgi:hypothetical protein